MDRRTSERRSDEEKLSQQLGPMEGSALVSRALVGTHIDQWWADGFLNAIRRVTGSGQHLRPCFTSEMLEYSVGGMKNTTPAWLLSFGSQAFCHACRLMKQESVFRFTGGAS